MFLYMVKKKSKNFFYKNRVFNNTPLDSLRSKSLIKFSIFVWFYTIFDVVFNHTQLCLVK